LTALTGSVWLYLAWAELSSAWIETPAALLFFLLLFHGERHTWFWTGVFLGLFWFWWIGVSFFHYGHPWAVGPVILSVALIYGLLFWIMAFGAEWTGSRAERLFSLRPSLVTAAAKAVLLWLWSFIHPFGFDWFKPELPLVHTVFGVTGYSFAFFLAGSLFLGAAFRRRGSSLPMPVMLFSSCLLFAPALDFHQARVLPGDPEGKIVLAGTKIPVEEKWRDEKRREQIMAVLKRIDGAVAEKKRAVIFPESVLPLFLNRTPGILRPLRKRSRHIDIVLGSLCLSPDRQNRNSAYFFHDGNYTIADKVVLVPFGEANPLPAWAGRWINRIFFDGAPDYRAARNPTDFFIDGKKYRAAICFEGTSEQLYRDRPRRMVLLSNNGWFYPSVEPTLQRVLLEYYHRKYGTEIWHSVNMGESYVITGK